MLTCSQLIGPFKLIKTAADLRSFGTMVPIAGLIFGCENLAGISDDLI
jgi:hypothetical protein